MSEYVFVKIALTSLLRSEITAAGLPEPFDITLNGNILKVIYLQPLSAKGQLKLRNIVADHRSQSVAEVAVTEKVQDAMNFGRQIIAEFGAENIVLGYNADQVAYVAAKLSPVISFLITGSLKTALTYIESMPADPFVTPERVKRYSNKIRSYLGMPLI